MSKARHFSRAPKPKLQHKISAAADRVRRTNLSTSIAQRQSLQHRQVDNGVSKGNGDIQSNHDDDDDYWHRHDPGTTPPILQPTSNRNDQRILRPRYLKTVLFVLIAIFVSFVFIEFLHRDEISYDHQPPMQLQLDNSFKNYQHENLLSEQSLLLSTREKSSSQGLNSITDVVGHGMQHDRAFKYGVGSFGDHEGLNFGNEGTSSLHQESYDVNAHQKTRNAQNNLPILDHTTTKYLTDSTIKHKINQEDNYFTKTMYYSKYGKLQKDYISRLRYSPGIPLPNQHVQEKMDFLGKGMKKKKFKPTKQLLNQVKTYPHTISGLNCLLYGGPSHTSCQEIVYWKDIPSDSEYTSPFYYSKKQHQGVNIMDDDITANQRPYLRANEISRDSTNKYLIFQLDDNDWNNKRMVFETFLALSAAMGRTLVLPPREGLPISAKSKSSQNDRILSYDDFFHLDSLNYEHKGIHIITLEEFLLKEGLNGDLYRYGTSESMYVPGNLTSWDDLATDGVFGSTPLVPLWKFIRAVSYIAKSWDSNECIAAFPSTAAPEGNVRLAELMRDILLEKDRRPKPKPFDFQGRPIPANAATIERMREMMAGRSKLCLYDDEMQSAAVVYFPSYSLSRESQPNTHFYSFLFFEQWQQAMWTNRLIRDHTRYRDEIVCAAARIVEAIRKHSVNGFYDSIHISNISEEDIFYSLSEVETGSTIFVVSDIKSEAFISRLQERYNFVFLHDHNDLLSGINVNYYGLIEQIVASRGNQFFGTYSSTFSGYVSRLRGYYSHRDKILGYDEGKLTNTHLMPRIYRNELKIYQAIQQPFFAREFPIAWKDIDKGVGEMIWKGL